MNTLDNVSDSEKISLGQLETIEDIKQSIKDNISRNKEEFSFFEDAPNYNLHKFNFAKNYIYINI